MKKTTQSLQLAFLRLTFWLLSQISPKHSATRALKLMSTPRAYPSKPREQAILKKAEQSTIPYRSGKIALYRWGHELVKSAPTVLLVHGWEGRASNFGGIIEKLFADGWTVLAFDAPSHGGSDVQSTSMFDFTECVGNLLKDHQVNAIIAHSFGCVATTVSLSRNRSLSLAKLVMIASPNRFEDRLQQMVDLFQLSPQTVETLRSMLQRQANYPIFDFAISDLGVQIQVPDRLLFHDMADQVSLFSWSKEIADAWAQEENTVSKLVPIEGTGHNRILWDYDVINHIADFLCGRAR